VSARPQRSHSRPIDATDERPWLFRECENPVEVGDDAVRLLGSAQVGIREYERSDSVGLEGIQLGRR
jgi:hypothetical protein